MPLPPGSSSFPPAIAAAERRWYMVDQFVRGGQPQNVARNSRGPYCCPRVPVSGLLEIPAEKSGEFVRIEEKVYFPVSSAIRARAVIRDVATNVAYQVHYIQRRSTFIEAWVKRATPDA